MKANALVAAVLLAGYAFGPPLDAAALTLTRGRYLQLGTQSSIVVRWRTETATDSRVRYGTNPSNLSSVVDDSTSATEHVVKLTGLNPSTKYYYSVGHSEATLAGSTDHFFVAAPTPGTEQPTLIWVLGNSGTAIVKARAVRDAYFKCKGNQYTHLWLMLGDKAYHNRTDSDYQDALFNTYPTLLRQTTLWPALGHRDDGVTADSASQSGAYYDIFTLPAPTNLTANAVSSSQINLAWSSSTDNVGLTGYKVYRGGAQMTTVSGTSYQNTGASPSTSYTYTVAGYDAAGNTSAQASSASATTQAATLSITSYGATGNDTTDDTTAITNTIGAAQSQRKGVYVPPGTFRYTSFRFNGIALTGDGPTSILYAPNQASSMIILNGNGPVLKNLKVQTNGTSRTGADHNIFVEAATNFTIDNVEVTGSASAAILTYGSSGPGKIINNYVHDTFSDGIHNTGGAHDIIVANNRVRNTGDDMIAAVSYSPTKIVRNILVQDNDVAENDWGRGITSVGSADITIQGNKIGRTGCCAGILVATEPSYTSPPLSNVLIRNNTLSNNSGSTGHGAFLISAFNGNIDRVRFEGNTITNPVHASIKLEGTNSNTALINNTMTDAQSSGIKIVAGTNVYCSGNTMNASATTHSKCTGINNFTVTGSSLTY